MLEYVIPPKGRYRSYRGRYRVGNCVKIHEVNLHTTNKEIATKKLKELRLDAEREAEGLLPSGSTREAMRRPLEELFAEFLEDLITRVASRGYPELVRQRFITVAKACKWQNLRTVTAKSFMDWRNSQDDFEARTLNHYLDAAQVFLNWVEDTYEYSNPLKRVKKVKIVLENSYGPRAFSFDELARLIVAAPERALLYRFLALTGLRRQEARKLCWGDVQLGDNARLVLRPVTTKIKDRVDTVPLCSDLVQELNAIRPKSAKTGERFFRKGVPSYKTLHRDLAKAGIASKDAYERGIGFHTFRRTFITMGQDLGIH